MGFQVVLIFRNFEGCFLMVRQGYELSNLAPMEAEWARPRKPPSCTCIEAMLNAAAEEA
jgi:hypothetical protein